MESASNQSPSGRVFDLVAIGRALEELTGWNADDDALAPAATPGFRDARRRLLDGYAFIDDLLAHGKELFAYGGSSLLLEVNHIVLCGTTPARRAEFAEHIEATERRFYGDHECGADSFYDWADRNRGQRPLVFAAGVYRRIVSAPQLFIEGNQRAATLIASFVLGRGRLPPLVWTRETFDGFASLSAQCKAMDRRNFLSAFWGPALDWRLQSIIALTADTRFLAGRNLRSETSLLGCSHPRGTATQLEESGGPPAGSAQ